jgi:hypothetical protein
MINNEESGFDLSTKPVRFWLLWGGPIVVMLLMNFARLPACWGRSAVIGPVSTCPSGFTDEIMVSHTHYPQPIDAPIDMKTGQFSTEKGSPELVALRTDPGIDPTQQAY